MSFLIAVHVIEGFVLASDRRTTYNNTITENGVLVRRIGIHTTNSSDKTFICPNGSGISTCGEASVQGQPIAGFIQEMIRSRITPECDVEDIPNIIISYFNGLSCVPDTSFIVAGYHSTPQGKVQRLYKVRVKSADVDSVNTVNQGAIWDGESFTLTRLIKETALKNSDGTYVDLPQEDILWNYFTLQDAVDFARYAVETTIQTMRFKNVVETVGGGVDVLVVTPDETKWLQKVELK